MSPLIIIIAGFIGVTALVGGVAVMFLGNNDEKLEDRLKQLTSRKRTIATQESVLKEGALDTFQASGGSLQSIFARFGRFHLLFEQAGTSITLEKFLIVSAGLALAGAVAVIAAGLHPGLMPVTAGTGAVLPLVWLLWRRKKRFKKFASQLPAALELIARALRAGHSLAAGFQLVGQEVSEPLGTEFAQVFEEQNLGIPMDDALRAMTDRIPNLDLKFFVTAIVLQRQTGGDLAEILDKIGNLIRERFNIWGQIQALTGEGRLSGVVLMGLPPLLFLACYRLNPDYVMVLFTDPLGRKMLMVAVVMQLIGAFVIKKIVNIKV
ncbi:MAG: secretion protein [Planctomycetales bacterium]|nr:secretion protein [Planctomycetales bacterium]NIM09469.1 secretion protein [Planctomycetales bacterium]NIN08957.1 secretion protein [Planctomycetales bacterium]NIN78072.1 secretion protein [Planctomycetales bacterium]NIO35250.1 secretion protein [Planctomycetales bacterium]